MEKYLPLLNEQIETDLLPFDMPHISYLSYNSVYFYADFDQETAEVDILKVHLVNIKLIYDVPMPIFRLHNTLEEVPASLVYGLESECITQAIEVLNYAIHTMIDVKTELIKVRSEVLDNE